MTSYNIRAVSKSDLPALYRIAEQMHASHEEKYFERCLQEREQDKREILVADQEGELVGYIQVIWSPVYPLFRKLGIPEIQDLNVVPSARNQGVGTALVEACETLAKYQGKTDMGIAVGLDSSFGAAQRLYVKRGYVPDGNGACYDEEPIVKGSMRTVDDLLTLKLVKSL